MVTECVLIVLWYDIQHSYTPCNAEEWIIYSQVAIANEEGNCVVWTLRVNFNPNKSDYNDAILQELSVIFSVVLQVSER